MAVFEQEARFRIKHLQHMLWLNNLQV